MFWGGIISPLLVSLNCTKLDNPNDRFGGVGGGGGAVANGGSPSTGGHSNSDAGCTDPSGFDGHGCYACAPIDFPSLENACTTSTCSAFNNVTRLTKLLPNGQLPPLPASSTTGGTMAALETGGSAGSANGGVAGGVSSSGGVAGIATTLGQVAGSSNSACDTLTSRGTVVYVTGSSAAKPFLQQIAQQISDLGVYVVYTSTGSCVGVDAILNSTPMTTGSAPAPAVSATYWDSVSSAGTACDLPSGGVTADLGVSDVFAQTCPGFELSSLEASQVREAHGPIQTMTFVVPANASHSEISAQAAYFVFGFGSSGGVLDADATTPLWNDEAYLFQRSATSGTQAMIAAAIGVPANLWKGQPHKSSDDMSADVVSAGTARQTADKALGILAADYVDSRNLRAQIRMLAFQDTNQPCAFYPDSTASARDKKNVRDGHYPIWSPLHILYKADSSGNPINPASRQQILDIVGYLSGTKALPNGIELIDVYAQSGLIPECAMRVARQKDGGNITPYVSSSPCGCLFEFKATGSTSCKPCKVQGDCDASATCSLGYCEK